MVLDYMNEMEDLGKVSEDHCAIVKIYEKNMGVVVKRQEINV
jgi:2-hydroxy-3-oxopropionate reductase